MDTSRAPGELELVRVFVNTLEVDEAVDELAEKPGFTDRISLQRATEIVATLLSPETYGLLVAGQGWTTPDWADWITRHLIVDLFPADPANSHIK
jgi:hypothetical protein